MERGGELTERGGELAERGGELQNKLAGIFQNGELPYTHKDSVAQTSAPL